MENNDSDTGMDSSRKTTLEGIHSRAESLLKFSNKLGIEEEKVISSETKDRLQIQMNLKAELFQEITSDDLEGLITEFREGISLVVGDDLVPFINVSRGVSEDDIKNGLIRLSKLKEEIEFKLIIDKQRIINRLSMDTERHNCIYFFFVENLVRFLESPLTEVDGELFAAQAMPTLVILAEKSVKYRGELLSIFSEGFVQKESALIDISDDTKLLLESCYNSMDLPPRWASFHINNITPAHFLGEHLLDLSEPLRNALANLMVHATILYTANHSTSYQEEGSIIFESTFASTDETKKIRLTKGIVSEEAINILKETIFWPFRGKSRDRLTIFQNVVTRELHGESPQANYKLFVDNIGAIISSAKWNHRAYLSDRINDHFIQVQNIVKLVSNSSRLISDYLDNTTKGFIESILSSLAVVVGTMIASLVKADISASVFRFGMWVYGLYLSFVLFFRMIPILLSFVLTVKETEDQLDRYRNALGRERVDEFTTPLKKRKIIFVGAYFIVYVVYLMLTYLVFWMGKNISYTLIP